MEKIWEPVLRDLDGKRFDLRGPQRSNAKRQTGKRKAADPIKEAAHRQAGHLTTAAMVRVTLIADCAV